MKLTLSSDKLCMFLSVAQIFDDQPELSHAVTERDLIVSEMQTFRQPPLEQLANNDGKGLHPRKLRSEIPRLTNSRRDISLSKSRKTRVTERWWQADSFSGLVQKGILSSKMFRFAKNAPIPEVTWTVV